MSMSRSGRRSCGHDVAKPLGPERVETVRGLVQHHDVEVAEQRLRKTQALEVAFRQLLDRLGGVLVEAQLGLRGAHQGANIARRNTGEDCHARATWR